MPAGYSGTPLVKKLGIREDFRVAVSASPVEYGELVSDLPSGLHFAGPDEGDLDMVHLFVREKEGLEERLSGLRERIRPAGMIWVSWPKKASGVETDVNGNVIRGAAAAAGLVDVKVCAVDDTWSGLKLVIPVKDRP